MDAWMHVPGASVDGHRGAVAVRDGSGLVSCACGRPFPRQPSVQGACLALVLHLQSVVKDGAEVTRPDEDDGLGGVREPRRPVPSRGSGGLEVDSA